MLKIRLRRTGAKKQPRYRVVVAESNAPRDGAFVEILGWYNPQAEPTQIVINTSKAAEWIARGAQPSDRVANLIKRVEAQQQAAASAEEEAAAPAPKRGGRRSTATTKVAAASDAPESEGSAASLTQPESEPVASEAPESEGSAGAAPA